MTKNSDSSKNLYSQLNRRRLTFSTALLPRSKLGWTSVGLVCVLAGLCLLGKLDVRLGTLTFPELHIWWPILATAGAFCVVPPSKAPLRPLAWTVLAMTLALTSKPLGLWQNRVMKPNSPLTAQIHRLSRPSPRAERTVVLESLRLEGRKHLSRFTGRRRDVVLEVTGFLFAPEDGTYRFWMACDDRCRLTLDGTIRIDSAGLGDRKSR